MPVPAASVLGSFGHIFWFIVVPVLLLIGVGFALQKTLTLDMGTLGRLNFYVVVPAIIYYSLVGASADLGRDAVVVAGFGAVYMLACAGVAFAAGRLTGIGRETVGPLVLAAAVVNSGNFGLPLMQLAFRDAGLGDRAMALQAFMVIVTNLLTFTAGVFVAARGKGRTLKKTLWQVVCFPPIWAVAAGLVTLAVRHWLGANADAVGYWLRPFWNVVGYAKDALIAVALVTLGGQLALVEFRGKDQPVWLAVGLRMVAGPAVALGLIYLFGLSGFVAQVLFIGSAAPTAVNAMLLCLQFKNHPSMVARTVFVTTCLSGVTVTLVIVLARSGWLARLEF